MTAPFFLSAAQAREAFEAFVLPGIMNAMEHEHVNRRHLHVVALKPDTPFVEGAKLPVLFEYSIGNRLTEWQHWNSLTFDDFARGKAALTWRTGLSSREVVFTKPQLLRKDDCALWGSAVIDGVIVGVSGVQPFFDEMFARMTCAAIIGEASYYADQFASAKNAPDFLA